MTTLDFFKLQHHWLKISFAILALILFVFPMLIQADQNLTSQGISNKNPGTDLWREVRQRESTILKGRTQVKSVDSNVLINSDGDKWAKFRMQTLIHYSQYFLAAVLVVLLLIFLFIGTSKVEGGLSGNMVQRFKKFERVIHWAMAGFFLLLAITGLVLMFGRGLLIPLLGHETFSSIAALSKLSHNWSGPLFLFSLLLMLITYIKRNMYARGDMQWLFKAGGLIGDSHPSAGFFNMGEKIMFWLVILVGLVLSVSGLILLMPGFGQGRSIMELSHVVHGISSIFLIALTFGHIYMAVVGVEGTTQAMTHGYVDIKWVEAHHDRWAEECKANNQVISAEEFERLQKDKTTTYTNSVSTS